MILGATNVEDAVCCIHRLWALSLASGNDEDGFEQNATWSGFTVVATLTDQGLKNVSEVSKSTLNSTFLVITQISI